MFIILFKILMNAPRVLVKTVEVALIKSMVTPATVLMDMMEPTVKLVTMLHPFKFIVDIKTHIWAFLRKNSQIENI